MAETPLFSRQAREVWDDSELEAFIDFIARNPEAGDMIPETGGVRVIYFYHDAGRPLYLLMVYAKARQENLTPDEKRAVRKWVAVLKG